MNDLVQVVPRRDGDIPVREVRGELDASNVDDVLGLLLDGIAGDAPGLVLDLRRTTYLDSAGIRVLFELARRLRSRRQQVRLVVDDRGVVGRVVALTALADVVPVDRAVADAVAALRRRA